MTDPTTPTPLTPPASSSTVPAAEGEHVTPEATGSAGDEGKRGRRKRLLVGGAGVAALLVVGISVLALTGDKEPQAASAPTKTSFAIAKERCGSAATIGAQLGDADKTLTLRGEGNESGGLSYPTLECYWSALDMPDSVKAEVGATRALDGRQSGDWADIQASWSYHPDSGLQMVLALAD
ncbi:hypothetical protein [Micromonospora psammae]|uniref:hypothetical protein n=1 Tax=Micromonospora sp. CPCC 205556 TaxID=3122398 RepID=UPI002FF0A07F